MKKPMRERLLDAGWRIARDKGLAQATTRNIALEAGVAEGSIYKHFSDKTDLVLALVLERAGDVKTTFRNLHASVGTGSVAGNLVSVMVEMIGFYERVQIVIAGSLSDPEMMKKMRQVFREEHKGPQRAHDALAFYLDAERADGRIAADIRPEILASLILGAAHERAFLNRINGESMSPADRRDFAAEIITALLPDQ